MAGSLGFGTAPTLKRKPSQIDTQGRPVGASFTPTNNSVPSGGGGISSVGFPGGGRVISANPSTKPGQGYGPKPTTTALGTTPAGAAPKGSTGAAVGTPAGGPPAGAPDPGTPNTGAIPPIQSDEDAINDANTSYGQAYNSGYQGLQDAALAYGDPTIMAQYGVGTVNPNSALALAAQKALLANQQNDATQTNNGTFFSSINQTARDNIRNTQQEDIANAAQAWQDALAKFNQAVGPGGTATTTRDAAIRNAREDEATQAVKNLPTRAAPVSHPAAPTTTTTKGGNSTPVKTHSAPAAPVKGPAHGVGATMSFGTPARMTFNVPKGRR